MPCLRPIPATQDDLGLVTLKQTREEAVLEPGAYLELSCGNCLSCRARRVRDWAIRCHHEAQMHTRAVGTTNIPNGCFVTLTYNDEHLPEDGSLHVEHWQNFAKRLRHKLGPFRFLHCGEYGSRNGRPHYHACLFGIDFHADRTVFFQKDNQITWLSETLSRTWSHGFTTLSPLNFATASYCAGYVMKKMKGSEFRALTDVYGATSKPVSSLKEEYVTMSRLPGLGTSWFNRYWPDVYPQDAVHIGGKTYRPPKFYDKLLKASQPCLYDEVMEKRKEFLDTLGPTSNNELKARNRIAEQKFSMKKERM